MGFSQIVTLSDGIQVPNPKYLRNLENRLKKIQRKFSKTKKSSKGREKLRLKVATLHIKITNCRKDFLHKLSTLITKKFDGICVENLDIKGMLKNRRLAKSLQDLAWSKFVTMLEYKALWAGKTLLKAGRFFPSSKLCHRCNHKNTDLKLSDRVWTCPKCGTSHDRDVNAAINLKNYFHSTLGTRGIYAGGDDVGLKPAMVIASQLPASNAIVFETRSPSL